ncbi:palmitoyltransferase PFA3 [Trypanosoma grayi]|uniref:palmitoyltransferase PFA3 n=1 Tax=Trypanosoma grayi TaxID=71804 RepID=UPI0004F49A39|nr:palmitoyltransferase PFA3 [Trypanosoma grayi]KEG14724.1 palmitoyltransferase PFA3 [Trypanosoma grayi]
MRCCGRSVADVIILTTLFVVTSYSAHSYYTFLFPETLSALALAFLQPFRREIARPTSSSPLHLNYLFDVSPKNWIMFGVSVFLFALATWAYVAAVVTDPGRVPQAFRQRSPKSASLALRLAGGLHMCPVCASYKPQRAHHCSRCRRCVLKYDHHCPWLGQCVGFFNYKQYLLVVFYTFIFTLWVCVLLFVAIGSYIVQHYQIVGGKIVHRNDGEWSVWRNGKCWTGPLVLDGGVHPKKATGRETGIITSNGYFGGMDVCPPFLGVYVCLTEALIFLVLTASLLKKHFWLARHNSTTLDLVVHQHQLEEGIATGPPVNQFDVGVKANLQQVFGDGDEHGEHVHPNFIVRWFCRLLPFLAYPKQLDFTDASQLSSGREESPFVSPFPAASHMALTVPNYGTLRQVGPGSATSDRGLGGNYHGRLPLQSQRPMELLRGICFPALPHPTGDVVV